MKKGRKIIIFCSAAAILVATGAFFASPWGYDAVFPYKVYEAKLASLNAGKEETFGIDASFNHDLGNVESFIVSDSFGNEFESSSSERTKSSVYSSKYRINVKNKHASRTKYAIVGFKNASGSVKRFQEGSSESNYVIVDSSEFVSVSAFRSETTSYEEKDSSIIFHISLSNPINLSVSSFGMTIAGKEMSFVESPTEKDGFFTKVNGEYVISVKNSYSDLGDIAATLDFFSYASWKGDEKVNGGASISVIKTHRFDFLSIGFVSGDDVVYDGTGLVDSNKAPTVNPTFSLKINDEKETLPTSFGVSICYPDGKKSFEISQSGSIGTSPLKKSWDSISEKDGISTIVFSVPVSISGGKEDAFSVEADYVSFGASGEFVESKKTSFVSCSFSSFPFLSDLSDLLTCDGISVSPISFFEKAQITLESEIQNADEKRAVKHYSFRMSYSITNDSTGNRDVAETAEAALSSGALSFPIKSSSISASAGKTWTVNVSKVEYSDGSSNVMTEAPIKNGGLSAVISPSCSSDDFAFEASLSMTIDGKTASSDDEAFLPVLSGKYASNKTSVKDDSNDVTVSYKPSAASKIPTGMPISGTLEIENSVDESKRATSKPLEMKDGEIKTTIASAFAGRDLSAVFPDSDESSANSLSSETNLKMRLVSIETPQVNGTSVSIKPSDYTEFTVISRDNLISESQETSIGTGQKNVALYGDEISTSRKYDSNVFSPSGFSDVQASGAFASDGNMSYERGPSESGILKTVVSKVSFSNDATSSNGTLQWLGVIPESNGNLGFLAPTPEEPINGTLSAKGKTKTRSYSLDDLLSSDVRLSGTSLTVGDRTFEVWTKDRTVGQTTTSDGTTTDRFTLSDAVVDRTDPNSDKIQTNYGDGNKRNSPFIPCCKYGSPSITEVGKTHKYSDEISYSNIWKFDDPNLLSKLKTGPFGSDPSQISLLIKNIKINIQPIDASLSKEATCDIRITASSDACKMTWMKVYYHNTAASPNGYSTEFGKGEDDEIVLKDSSSNTLAYVIPPTAEQMNNGTKSVYYAKKGYAI
jgi:hypothetical protein